MTPAQYAAVLDYIDDQDQQGSRVEPDEVLDVLRGLDDHPRDEGELRKLAFGILSRLLDEGLIAAWGTVQPEWLGDEADVQFGMAPRRDK